MALFQIIYNVIYDYMIIFNKNMIFICTIKNML